MTQENTHPEDDLKRTIVLMYGMLDSGVPFWLFAAVKPANYQEFQIAYKEKKIDVHNFQPFGEIIVCGSGKGPPDNVTVKVAEMYQTSVEIIKSAISGELN